MSKRDKYLCLYRPVENVLSTTLYNLVDNPSVGFNDSDNISVNFYYSKSYPQKNCIKYWFAYRPDNDIYLTNDRKYYAFACLDSNFIFIISFELMQILKEKINITDDGDLHYHIIINTYENGSKILKLNDKQHKNIDITTMCYSIK